MNDLNETEKFYHIAPTPGQKLVQPSFDDIKLISR